MQRIDARRVPHDDAAAAAKRVVSAGGVVIFPTDTVYGIGCDPGCADAVARIFALKDRPRTKPLALHVHDTVTFAAFAGANTAARALADTFLPGPLTVIVARPPRIAPAVAAGLPSVGLRVPDHSLCRSLLEATGPLAATSANRSGQPAYTGGEIPQDLPEADLLIWDGATTLETESTVVDVSDMHCPRLIRSGALATDLLENVLGTNLR